LEQKVQIDSCILQYLLKVGQKKQSIEIAIQCGKSLHNKLLELWEWKEGIANQKRKPTP